MRKRILILLGVLISIVSCEKKEQEVPVTSVSISQAIAEIVIGESVQLQAAISPSNATEKTILWGSSKQSVATVSNSGLVTAIAEGSTTVSATAGGRTATCQVIVSKGYVAVASVSLSKTEITLEKGKSETIIATVNPTDATDKTVTWSSSNKEIASVDSNGSITAVGGGSATITAKAGSQQATCKVTVIVPVESISLDRESITIEEESSITLVATVKPDDATNKAITWSSSDSQIATVDEAGKITAIKEGEATITAKAGDKTAECKVTVQKKFIAVTSISLNKTELALEKGKNETLVATVKPDDATDKTITWSSSDNSVATVDQDGKVTAVSAGKAEIIAKAGNKSASCYITVTIPATSISLNKSELELEIGQSETLSVIFEPEDATEEQVKWSSQNESVAMVDQDGKVLAISEGVTTVTATVGSIKAVCSVKSFYHDPKNIRFADANIKSKLVAAFDTNGDGELSYDEAASITSGDEIKTAIGGIKTYRTFEEFRFFTGVTKIPKDMFNGWTLLSAISLPERITSIGAGAFRDCPMLTMIHLPESVSSIGESAFRGCSSLFSINLPKSVLAIGESAFYGCSSLSSITLPNNISTINNYLFYGCSSLTEMIIPQGVTLIGYNAFGDCSNLASITIPASVSTIKRDAFHGCFVLSKLYLESLTDWLNVSFDSSYGYPTGHPFVSSVFGQLYENGIEVINVNFPDGISSIKPALYGCSHVVSVTIPESVSIIEDSAFNGCKNLSSISIPESVSTIGNDSFEGCSSLTSIIVPESVSRIGEYAWAFCTNLSSITLPESVSSIGQYAFYQCSGLTSITIPNRITTISKGLFHSCSNLTYVTLPEDVSVIDDYAFYQCSSLPSITLPKGVSSIRRQAFYQCLSLSSIILPEGVSFIDDYAFYQCSSLSSITLPESIKSIGHCAFYECIHMKSITVKATAVPRGGSYMFDGADDCQIFVPETSIEAYKTSEWWRGYANRIQAITE